MNIRGRINQLLDKKNISGKQRDIINQGLDQQNQKGLINYGQTLDDCPDGDYDWNQMTIEELLDALQYQVKENNILRKKIAEEKAQRIRAEHTLNQIYRGEHIETFN